MRTFLDVVAIAICAIAGGFVIAYALVYLERCQ